MRLRYHPDGVELYDIHPLFAELLADLPRVAARHEGAHARLYPDPFGADASQEDTADWREHVEPELAGHFASCREKVAADLLAHTAPGGKTSFYIKGAHLAAWLNALNQARLVIVEENKFGERDLSGSEPPDLSTRRGLSLLKVHFYAHLQELLIEAAGG